jgi:hypothetical protein
MTVPFGVIGTKPAEMFPREWALLCRKYGARPQCQCRFDGNCPKVCAPIGPDGSYKLDCDRIVPGGDYSADNCVFRCPNGGPYANRNRQDKPDPEWSKDFFFDSGVDATKLRPSQLIGPWGSVMSNAGIFRSPPPVLFTRLLLCAAFTGAGKVASGLAICAAINSVRLTVSPHARRIRRVLWLTQQHALSSQLAHELVTDYAPATADKNPRGIGLLTRTPRVKLVKSSDWSASSAENYDIWCAVPQALWLRKNEQRPDDEIQGILRQFDMIIGDECDWATWQLDRLIQLTPHAYHLGLTATPLDGDGEIPPDRFVLLSVSAHQEVQAWDESLKHLPADAAGKLDIGRHDPRDHDRLCGGELLRNCGVPDDDKSLPGEIATIMTAIMHMRDLEAAMRKEFDGNWFSPHMMIRTDGKQRSAMICRIINYILSQENYKSAYPRSDGWAATYIHSDMEDAEVPIEERRLFPTEASATIVHPWLTAKEHHGARCKEKDKRILVVCDMGIRGLNNWACTHAVNLCSNGNVREAAQFELGRPSRWPTDRASWLAEDDPGRKFAAMHVFVPHGRPTTGLQGAFEWVLEMKKRLEDGLTGIGELGRVDLGLLEERTVREMLTRGDKAQLEAAVGQILMDDVTGEVRDRPSEDEVETIIDELPPEVTTGRRNSARRHIEKILDDPGYRARELGEDENEPIEVVAAERGPAPETMSTDDLIAFVERDWAMPTLGKGWMIRGLTAGDPGAIELVRMSVTTYHRHVFVDPPSTLRLNSNAKPDPVTKKRAPDPFAVLPPIQRQLWEDLSPFMRGDDNRDKYRNCAKAVALAVARIFGVKEPRAARNDGPLDRPAYHSRILQPDVKKRIYRVAKGLLVRWGELPQHAKIFGRDRDETAEDLT